MKKVSTALMLAALAVLAAVAPPAAAQERPPVVMVAFDELPVDALLGPDGNIDRGRFPNFARLADRTTWYPNASTVADWTWRALPAALTGLLPRKDRPPQRSRDRSIFRLLANDGYAIHGSEEVTSVCDEPGCRNFKHLSFDELIRGGRFERLQHSVAQMQLRTEPTFNFHDAILPHQPWVFLPSGLRHQPGVGDFNVEVTGPPGFHDPHLAQHTEQRFLLQLGAVDRALGGVTRRLDETGVWDRALVIVTADHGIAFDVGVKDRRKITRENIHEVAFVPLFIKPPGQRGARRDYSFIRTVDLPATIASILHMRLPWRTVGHPAGSRAVRRRRTVEVVKRDFSGTIEVPGAELAFRRARNVLRRARTYGSGSWAPLYRVGPRHELVGRPLAGLARAPAPGARADVPDPGRWLHVRRATGIVPASVGGVITGGSRGAVRDLAVALNGRVVATGRSFHLKGRRGERLSVMVPEAALREGRNRLELFEVAAGRRPRLAPLPIESP